ncbi:hypothetical protein GGF46_005079 [Coemansia sp. RSA 552]|nr:hypothetical protein GGF46_005079 [Coemansia sp. RSA 552]
MLRAFRIPETRLLAINDLVAQVTLTYRTDEDEEMGYRYERDAELQSLVQTSVVSLVNCGYTHGVARGPGFVLHQMRKKWPIGRRYIFTQHGEPMQSSLHKYFFQLELVDEIEMPPPGPPMLEISELRGVALSPSVSSIAGSTIEGLDAVALPPMSAMFDQGYPPAGGGHRRSGSALSGRSVNSAYSGRSSYLGHYGRPRSPFYYDGSAAQQHRPSSPSPRRYSVRGVGSSVAMPEEAMLESEYRSAQEAVHLDDGLPPSMAGQNTAPGSNGGGVAAEHTSSPVQSTVRTRSVSRSSAGTIQSVVEAAPEAEDRASRLAVLPPSRIPKPPPAQSASSQAGEPAQRLGRTTWYRSLHGISPLSRQQKSLSSSDNEMVLGADGTAVAAAAADITQIPRVAGNGGQALSTGRPPPGPGAATAVRDAGNGSPSLGGIAHRLKRKILSPINIHRSRHGSKLSRELRASDKSSGEDLDTSDFTGPDSDDASDKEVAARLQPALSIPEAVAADHKRKLPPSSRSSASRRSSVSTEPSREMPPPSKRPARREQPSSSRSLATSIPSAVKDALLRRLRSPLGRHPDRSSSQLSVRDRIAAFNSLSVNTKDGGRGRLQPKDRRRQSASLAQPLTPVTEESAGEVAPMLPATKQSQQQAVSQIQMPSTPPVTTGGTRMRLATATGFISVATTPGNGASVARPHSRASSMHNGRPASPALSQMSNVSTRVMDTINALERAGVQTTPHSAGVIQPAGSGRSGTKRQAGSDVLDHLASPTKRPRAPSSSAIPQPVATSSRLNPLNMVQRMVRRHTGR